MISFISGREFSLILLVILPFVGEKNSQFLFHSFLMELTCLGKSGDGEEGHEGGRLAKVRGEAMVKTDSG